MLAPRDTLGAAACLVMLLVSGCDVSVSGNDGGSNKVNGSIDVPAGKAASDVHTVNGSITIEDNAVVEAASTVNGNIKLGAHATATTLHTVNGRVSLGAGAHASEAGTVNGDMSVADGADLAGHLGNVSGKITVTNAHVGGGIKTANGDISVLGTSRIEGGITIEAESGNLFHGNDPVVTIGPGATVQGDMVFKRTVKLYVSDHATIGNVTGATAITFSGDKPSP